MIDEVLSVQLSRRKYDKDFLIVRIWLDIYDPTYTNKLGDGPIRVRGAKVKRGLDETGSGSADLNGIDPRVISLMSARRICEMWAHEDGFSKRLLGSFVIEGDNYTLASGTRSRGVSGRNSMVALANKIVLPGLRYQAQTVQDVVDDLCGLAGWTADIGSSFKNDLISVQFGGGESVLRALQVIAEIKGVHLREDGNTDNQIEMDVFGSDAGVWIEYIEGDAGEIHRRSTSPMLIEQLTVNEESADIFNYALGFAGGSGDAAIDLGLSTRPFVDSITANGRTHYIIKDNASIGVYGQIERRVDAKRIVPTATTDSALQYAANAAADAIKAKLDRHSQPQEILTVSLRNVRQTIEVGDKIHLTYQGMTNKNNLPYVYREIDADYWVMRATEIVRLDGIILQLVITNIDRYQADAAGVLVGMVDKIQAQEVDVQPYPTNYPWGPFQQPIDTTTSITFKFPIFDNVLRLNSVTAYIIRDNWTAVAGVAQDGGDHLHLMFEWIGSPGTGPIPSDWQYHYATDVTGAVNRTVYIPNVGGGAIDLYTKGGSGDHTHDTEFSEVQKDNLKPSDLDVTVNGVSVATGLFPDDGGDEYVDADIVKIDITDEVKNKSGGFRTWHTMGIDCGADRGDISVVFLIDVDISKVRTS